jgi:hypothetical protein
MDEGIIEGSEDTGDAKDHFAYENGVSQHNLTTPFRDAHLRELGGLGRYSPWRGVRPSFWEASCAVCGRIMHEMRKATVMALKRNQPEVRCSKIEIVGLALPRLAR